MQNLFENLIALLKTRQEYVDNKGNLNITRVQNKAYEANADLLDLLLSKADIRAKFFTQTARALVFNRNDFLDFISNKNFLANSYTRYKNKIGLGDGKNFLKASGDIVLMFPFKDCLLEGGMSSEDDGRNEVFYNELLAPDEIDRLLSPKLFTNIKRISANGEARVEEFARNENGRISENLLIKSNNLIALHSLKSQFAGRVKLIYIDPPYNTGNDSFLYNDRFNHSTWLTFMKNRLEVARDLLRDDGVIFVSCDDTEHAYLKVLMDELYGRENFIVNFVWQTKKGAQGIITQNKIVSNHENILVFARQKNLFQFKGIQRSSDDFSNPDNDPRGKWKRQYLQRFGQGFSEKTITNPKNGMKFTFETPYSQEKLEKWIQEERIIFPQENNKFPARKEFLNEYSNNKQIVSSLGLFPTKASTEDLYRLFDGQKIFKNPKPEQLIQFVIEQGTQPGDIVLDYHLGSGTSSAVAHKLGRQYIGIEQMDYIEYISAERLKKVIGGEQGGISKAVDWQGGGDFIYLELAPLNQSFIDSISRAKDSSALLKIREKILESHFTQYQLDKEAASEPQEFLHLNLNEQKQVLISMLDKNQLYINYSEHADALFACSTEDIELSENFYGK